jgi:two-component system nitrate/nitrite response regulator NarL
MDAVADDGGSDERPLRVIVVDDHPIVGLGFRRLVERAYIDVIGVAGDGPAGVELARRVQPDVVLMDVVLPGLRGPDATRLILQQCPQTRVLAYSAHAETALILEMLDAGVSGYLLKLSGADEIITAIRTVARGFEWVSPEVATALAQAQMDRRRAGLSPREVEILRLVAAGRRLKEIAFELRLSLRTVQTHRTEIMTKLGMDNVAGLVKYAIRVGLSGLGA